MSRQTVTGASITGLIVRPSPAGTSVLCRQRAPSPPNDGVATATGSTQLPTVQARLRRAIHPRAASTAPGAPLGGRRSRVGRGGAHVGAGVLQKGTDPGQRDGKIRFPTLKRREVAQRGVVVDGLGHAPFEHRQVVLHTTTRAAGRIACRQQQRGLQVRLRVGPRLQLPQPGKLQVMDRAGPAHGAPDRALIEQQPGLGHPNRHERYDAVRSWNLAAPYFRFFSSPRRGAR